jgi:hypothetical protein
MSARPVAAASVDGPVLPVALAAPRTAVRASFVADVARFLSRAGMATLVDVLPLAPFVTAGIAADFVVRASLVLALHRLLMVVVHAFGTVFLVLAVTGIGSRHW